MPHGDEAKHCQLIRHAPDLALPAGRRTPAQRDEQVPQRPLVEAPMPAAPEVRDAVVVRHAADHVLGGVDAVEQRPEAEEAPRQQELQPDVLEVEEAEHGELARRVGRPGRPRVEDGHHVEVVDEEFHGQEHDEEAHRVEERARTRDAVRPVPELRGVVVEG